MMDKYFLTVGLEVHAELNTRTKMFCDSKNVSDETEPNIHICPVCLGYPGTLPVINKEAVKSILRFGLAVKGELADYTEFDRKNYFYPDIPKGYQISQYKFPLVKGGELRGVKLTRVHLEEDTARSTHDKGGESLVDFNRAGVPLMELVTEPVIHDAVSAADFARELQLLLNYLGIANANMEKGEMRIEANISVAPEGQLGKKVEVKNINSFKAVEKAINFEFKRQTALLEKGESVVQETMGWDENKSETFSQRLKEDSHDYRYFPDPDLPKLYVSVVPEFAPESLRGSLPELPHERRGRMASLGIAPEHIEIYVANKAKGQYFEAVAQLLTPKLNALASNYVVNELKDESIEATKVAEVIEMINAGELSSRGAKEVLKILSHSNSSTREIAEENDLIQRSNIEELSRIAEKIINENKIIAEEFKNGKASSLQFLIGQAMKETKGSGNPTILKEIFEKLI